MQDKKLIVLEGLDGSGKSTQALLLTHALQQQGHKVWFTAEPTKGDIGKLIREIFSGKKNADHNTIAALFAADRLQHILDEEEGMLHKIEQGFIVICDRYYFSSYAYHSVHVPMEWVIACNKRAATLLKPDLHVYIDVSPEVCMDRIATNRHSTELYETLDNLKAVQANYFKAFDLMHETEKVIKINGTGTVKEVHQLVLNSLNTL